MKLLGVPLIALLFFWCHSGKAKFFLIDTYDDDKGGDDYQGMPGGMPGGMPEGMPGGMPGGMSGGMPGGMPGGGPGGMPGGGMPGGASSSREGPTIEELD